MKRTIKRTLIVLLLMLFITPVSAEGKFSFEVDGILKDNHPNAQLEGYLEILGTPQGDYAVAVIWESNERLLLLFHEDGDSLPDIICRSALPQDRGYVRLIPHYPSVAEWTVRGEGIQDYENTWGFTMELTDPENEEWASKSVSYHWQKSPYLWGGEGFTLFSYMDRNAFYGMAFVEGDMLSFYDLEGVKPPVRVQGDIARNVQIDMTFANFADLPKTPQQAQGMLGGTLQAKQISFDRGQSYPVHMGPGAGYPRSGNGKGTVSTNGVIEVYGTLNGWALIGYDIDDSRSRIGWIDAAALPDGIVVGELAIEEKQAALRCDCVLTDDPFKSGSSIANLKSNTPVTTLASLSGDWFLTRAETAEGTIFGFISVEAIQQYSNTPLTEVQIDIEQRWPGYSLEDYLTILGTPDGDYAFALVRMGNDHILAGYVNENGVRRFLNSTQAAVPQGEASCYFTYWPAGANPYGNVSDAMSDGTMFSVTYLIPDSENGYRSVTFRWTANGFQLASWHDLPAFYGKTVIDGDQLAYWSWGLGEAGYAPNTLTEYDLWKVDYEALPKRLEDAGGSWNLYLE